MRTGAHIVRDCSCKVCGDPVGWKYVRVLLWQNSAHVQDRAFEPSEKYKEGHFILERQKIMEIREDPSLWSNDKGSETIVRVIAA